MDKKKILYVDDDSVLRELIGEVLKADDRTIDFAVDGEEGLEKLKKTKYDLVIIGIIMPKMSGLEMLQQMKAAGIQQHKVIIFSNMDIMESAKEELRDLNIGIDDYYLKSDYTAGQFAEVVNVLLKK